MTATGFKLKTTKFAKRALKHLVKLANNSHNTAKSFSSIWVNGLVFAYKLSACVFEFH